MKSFVLAAILIVLVAFDHLVTKQVQAQSVPATPVFEVVSIKPSTIPQESMLPLVLISGSWGGGCRGTDTRAVRVVNVPGYNVPLGRCVFRAVTLKYLIFWAYTFQVPLAQVNDWITGGPDWAGHYRFAVEGVAEDPSSTTEEQLRLMLRDVLLRRFQLKFHDEDKEVSGFALIAGKDGTKLKPSTGGSEDQSRIFITPGSGVITGRRATMQTIADFLSSRLGKPVIDHSGVSGEFDFSFSADPAHDERAPAVPSPGSGPSIFTALERELGLALRPERIVRQLIVIDRAEKPSVN